jgi:hypothetical protein
MRKLLCLIALMLNCSCDSPDAESRRSKPGSRPPFSTLPVQPDTGPLLPEPERSDVEVVPVPERAYPALKGRQLIVNGRAFVMRAVCWNPVRLGQMHPEGLMFRSPSPQDLALIEQDFQMMQAMGVNTLRTYEAILDDRVLALVQKYQLHMIVPVFNYFATGMPEVAARVEKLRNHPGTLFWEIGNEWNYNLLYSADSGQALTLDAVKSLIKQAISTVRSVDSRLPIATVHGELPSRELIAELSGVDLWGLNIYSGLGFGDRFQIWSSLTDKPMYLAEYGADAINRTVLDEASQAKAVLALTREIEENLAARAADKVSVGGAVFEWNDEWWKDGNGAPDQHDIGGIAPGSGPYPDMTFNEEWWGIVTIDRKARPVYDGLKGLWNPGSDEAF